MATPAENLETLITNLMADLVANPPRPSYSIDGQAEQDNRQSLLASYLALRGSLNGPVEVESYGVI